MNVPVNKSKGEDGEKQCIPGNMICDQTRGALADLEAIEAVPLPPFPRMDKEGRSDTVQNDFDLRRTTTTVAANGQSSNTIVSPSARGAIVTTSSNDLGQNEPDATEVELLKGPRLDPTLHRVQQLNIGETSTGNVGTQQQSLRISQQSEMSVGPQDEHVGHELDHMVFLKQDNLNLHN